MKDVILLPVLPAPGGQYDPVYWADFTRNIRILLQELISRGDINVLTINATNLPDSSANLREGDFYVEDGYVRIAVPNIANPDSIEMTVSVGTVTVTAS